jgi:hypothetical protein
MGIRSGFVRTPKFSALLKNDQVLASGYARVKFDWITFSEGLLALYFLFGVVQAIQFQAWGTVPFLVLALMGFSGVFIGCLREGMNKKGLSGNGRLRRKTKFTNAPVPVSVYR